MYDALGLDVHHNPRHGVSSHLDISRIRTSLYTDLHNSAYLDVYLGKQTVG